MGISQESDKGPWIYLLGAGLIFSFLAGSFVSNPSLLNAVNGVPPYIPTTRHYTLIIEGTNISEGPSATWHAWTYNGTVPGPTLHAKVGDKIIVKVINRLNLVHSFHTHLVNYNFSYDGSQANVIVGMGNGSMIMPGQSYTYYFSATYAGVFLYHCHSSDKFTISYHIDQGLYGIIVIDNPQKPVHVAHDWTVVMGESGRNVSGTGAAPYIMNGIGFPGGEPALMNLYASQGIAGIEAQFNKTLLAFVGTVGQTVRFDLVNAGNLVHTFHLHDAELISEFQNPGVPVDDADLPLDPAVADAVLVNLTQPGVFLFHCHVVTHADAGMIGVLVVLPAGGPTTTGSSTKTETMPSSSTFSTTSLSTTTRPSQGKVSVSILPGSGADTSGKGYSPDAIRVSIGVNNTVVWTNNDDTPHTVTSDVGAFDSNSLNAGQTWTYTFATPGVYHYHCTYHYWMTGTVVATAAP